MVVGGLPTKIVHVLKIPMHSLFLTYCYVQIVLLRNVPHYYYDDHMEMKFEYFQAPLILIVIIICS